MDGFIETLTLILISCFIVNLIGSIYPNTKTKHTYMVVLSVIIVWICISPLTVLIDLFKDISEFNETEFLQSLESPYWEDGEEYEFVSSVYEGILTDETTS